MPRQRTAPQQLVRQFSAADRPIYLVDDRHVIVYCNPACAAWARVSEEELVGQTCVYGLPVDDSAIKSAAAAAARLCPAPGRSARRGCVSAIGERGELIFRQAEFLPLSAGTGSAEFSVEGPALSDDVFPGSSGALPPAGLLVLVDSADMAEPPVALRRRIPVAPAAACGGATIRRPMRCTPRSPAGGIASRAVIASIGWSAPVRLPLAFALRCRWPPRRRWRYGSPVRRAAAKSTLPRRSTIAGRPSRPARWCRWRARRSTWSCCFRRSGPWPDLLPSRPIAGGRCCWPMSTPYRSTPRRHCCRCSARLAHGG